MTRPTTSLVAPGLAALLLSLLLAACSLTPAPPTPAPAASGDPPARSQPATEPPESNVLPIHQEGPPDQATNPPAAQNPVGIAWLLDLSFVDAQHGWALGRSLACEGQRRCPVALGATSDGGQTWQALAAPETFQAGSMVPSGVEFVRFANRNVGWLFGPGLFATRDGGQTWQEHLRPGEIIALESAGSSVWAIERTCSNTTPGDCTLTLLVASLASQDWRPALVQPPLQGNGARLVRADSQHAWILHAGGIAATADGRASWGTLASPCTGATDRVSHLAALDSRTLWLLCTGAGQGDRLAKALYTSPSGGTHWNLAAEVGLTPDPARPYSLPVLGAPNDLAIVTEQRAFLALVRSTLASTRDGGQTWQPAITAAPEWDFAAHGGIWRVLFVGTQYGWAVGTTANGQLLFRTTDGGEVWEVVAHSPFG